MDGQADSLIPLWAGAESSAPGISLVWLATAFALLVVGHVMVRVAPTVWRFGFDARRALGHRGRSVRSLGFAFLLALGGTWLLHRLPAIIGIAALVAIVFLFAATGTLQDVLGGAFGQFRLRLREGDRLSVGSYEGEVRTLHWEHLVLRTRGGDSVHLPNRLLLREPVVLQPMRNTEPVTVTVPVPDPGAFDLGRLHDALALSPYRASGTAVSVERVDAGIRVQLYTWSRDAHDLALQQVRSLIGQSESA